MVVGVVKVVQWPDGTVDAIKIEGAGAAAEKKAEDIIMQEIGELRATFVRARSSPSAWIDNNTIQDKRYIVQKKHQGMEMWKYFTQVTSPATMPEPRKLEIALRTALAIQTLHDKNILHCDIKPENCMINIKGAVIVVEPIDFGFALRLPTGADHIDSPPCGTKGYAAPELYPKPEIAYPGGRFSKASDVYALGVLLRDDLQLNGIDAALDKLISCMTNEDPALRPSIQFVVGSIQLQQIKPAIEYLDKMAGKYSLSPRQSWRIQGKDQAAMVSNIRETLTVSPLNAQQQAEAILEELTKNQGRHAKTFFATASTLNLTILQKLPENIKTIVCDKLGINVDSDLLNKTDYSTRKKLATVLNKYIAKSSKSEAATSLSPSL